MPWKGLPVIGRARKTRRERAALEEFVSGIANRALGILDVDDRRLFLEKEIARAYGFRRAEIIVRPEGPERFSSESTRVRDLLQRILGILEGTGIPFLNAAADSELGVAAILRPARATYALPIARGEAALGLLLLDSSPRIQLPRHEESSLLRLCGQLAVVLENSALLRGKLELQDALARQEQLAQLGEMTARIAHEIKNPMSSIKTIVQVMQEDREAGERYSKDLEMINREIDRLSDSLTQLLRFARPAPDSREDVHLRETAESTLSFLSRDIEQSGVQVMDEIPATLPPLRGNAASFREILLNLLLNAVQAGGRGTRIWLRASAGMLEDGSERYVLLVVEDDGPGVPPEVRAKIFHPFFTTRQHGTGLGLAIVKRSVEQMKGSITMESPVRDGRGTRFLIHIPLAASSDGRSEEGTA